MVVHSRFKDMIGMGHMAILIILLTLIVAKYFEYVENITKLNIGTFSAWFFGLLLIGFGYFICRNALKVLPLEKRSRVLTRKGVYGFVRHPTYSAIIFGFYPGLGLLFKSKVILWSTLLVYGMLHALIKSEEKYQIYIFREEYHEYKKAVPAFIPKWWTKKFFRKVRDLLFEHEGLKGYIDLSKK